MRISKNLLTEQWKRDITAGFDECKTTGEANKLYKQLVRHYYEKSTVKKTQRSDLDWHLGEGLRKRLEQLTHRTR